MKILQIFAFTLAASLVVPVSVPAEWIHGTVYGVGQTSCGRFIAAREEKDETALAVFTAWMEGFMTALTLFDERRHPGDFAGGKDELSLLLWLENYCRANPLNDYFQAVTSLTNELIQSTKDK